MIDNKLLSDIAKFGNSTIGAMSGMQRQIKQMVAEQLENLTDAMELVSRKELDVYKQIAQDALIRVEALEKRLAEMEGKGSKKVKAKDSELE